MIIVPKVGFLFQLLESQENQGLEGGPRVELMWNWEIILHPRFCIIQSVGQWHGQWNEPVLEPGQIVF